MKKRKFLDGHSKTKLILTVLAAIIGFCLVYSVLSFIEKSSETGTTEYGNGFSGTGPEIVYNGEKYSYKSRLKNILFMGIDTTGELVDHKGEYHTGGQSDVLFLASIDHDNEEINVIQLDRDTMTMINAYDENGQNEGEYEAQLALAYYYGDGDKSSCRNTVNAVSKLLYGVSVDDYFSINMDAIDILNVSVGCVSVTIKDDFSEIDSSLVMGETITLRGEQAINFIRSRKNVGEGNNVERMSRHRDYLYSFKNALFAAAEKNPELIATMDESVADYRVTTMSLERMAGYLHNAREYKINDIIVPEHTADYSGEFVEVRLNEDKLKEMIVNLFFEKDE